MSEYIHISRIDTLPAEHFFRRLRGSEDPRVFELERLCRSLERAAASMDQFEQRLRGMKRMSTPEVVVRENGVASHVAAGLSKAHFPTGRLLDGDFK